MGIYNDASELVDSLKAALERGEPILVLGPHLMQAGLRLMERADTLVARTEDTLARVDGLIERSASLSAAAERLLLAKLEETELAKRKLALEITRLERTEGP